MVLSSKNKQMIYEAFNDEFLDENKRYIFKTFNSRWNKLSNNSLSFLFNEITNKNDIYEKENNKCEILKEVFNINDINFENKYNEAISGDGSENTRITVLNSSSLCALLLFYKVSKANPIVIDGIKYDKVHFEVKNRVFNTNDEHCSNMDVVLESDTDILFMECKFSEYLSLSNRYLLSNKYKLDYDKLKINMLYDYKIKNSNNLVLKKKDEHSIYISGIKQIISHYLALNNFINDGIDINGRIKLNNRKVRLVEVVFNSDKWDQKYFESYSKEYNELVNHLNTLDSNIELKNVLMTYQDIIKSSDNLNYYNNLDIKVKKFYNI